MRHIIIFSVFAIFLSGCSTSQSIHNVADSPVPSYIKASQNEVEKAIIKATSIKGWTISKKESGYIEAGITVRGRHHAVVGIPYSDQAYSINYVSSDNLDHKGDTIHRNYNKWVTLLDRQIQAELTKYM